MIGFRQRLRHAVSVSTSYKSDVYALAEDAGLGKKTIYNIINDDRLDTSKTGPGLFGMARVATLLNVSLDYLAGLKPPQPPGTGSAGLDATASDNLLKLHRRSGGRIEAFEPILDRCDQYFVPADDENCLRVKAVGTRSLSALTMGKPSPKTLEDGLNHMSDRDLLTRTIEDYRFARDRGTFATLESRNIQMPNEPILVKMDFVRTILFVKDLEGEETLLLFASLAT